MMKIFALLLTVATIYAQQPCNSPPQWQALRYMYIEEKNDYSRSFYSYDATNTREKIVQTKIVDGVTDGDEYLRLYGTNVEYVYTASTRKCVKNNLTQKFREFGVPAGATFAGETYYGASAVKGGSFLAQVWTAEINDNNGDKGRYTGFWTSVGCAPIEILGTFKNYAIHSQFFNITVGFSNPNTFVPRKECQNL